MKKRSSQTLDYVIDSLYMLGFSAGSTLAVYSALDHNKAMMTVGILSAAAYASFYGTYYIEWKEVLREKTEISDLLKASENLIKIAGRLAKLSRQRVGRLEQVPPDNLKN